MSRKGNIIYHISVAAISILMEIAALGMLKYNGVIQNNWLSKGIHGLMAGVCGQTESIKGYFSLRKENERLVRENYELAQQVRRYRYAMNTDFSADTTVSSEIGCYRYIPANILKMYSNSQHNYLIINKGSEDGVIIHSGIITPNGVVGVVDAVSRHYSYAIAFTNSNMVVSARLGTDGAVGTLRWDGLGSKGAILSEIPHHIAFEKGDTIYTSGYSAVFPADIPLGITGEKRLVNGSSYEIKVELFEDFSRIRHVAVVSNTDEKEIEELEQQ